jgi:thiol-disulfide isomerase/thioredoxin
MGKNTLSFAAIIVVIIVLIIVGRKMPGQYDAFAQCLEEEGAVFYGAFWCPNCQDQKEDFGNSEKKLPYVECSTPSGKDQTQECSDIGIEAYPTWMFSKGIIIEYEGEPTVCSPKPGVEGESSVCTQVAANHGKTWLFGNSRIVSPEDPVQEENIWEFPSSAKMVGVVSKEVLADQTGCVLSE